MKTRLLFAAASAVLMAGALRAQQQPNYYQTVNCIKVTDGKFDEYRQFINDAVKPMMQARANAGEIVAWSSMRSVMPAGTEARCDYRTVTLYDGVPPAPRGGQGLTDSLKAAGVKMTAAEYVAKRNSVSHLVAAEMWRSRVRVGQPQKGNYLFLNHMKVHDAAAYTKFETEVWRPLAEEWVKEGDQTGWVFNTLVLPSGTDTKYTMVTADIFPNWAAAFKSRDMAAAFKKVHPGKDLEHTMEDVGKMRDLAVRDLLVIEERVTKQ